MKRIARQRGVAAVVSVGSWDFYLFWHELETHGSGGYLRRSLEDYAEHGVLIQSNPSEPDRPKFKKKRCYLPTRPALPAPPVGGQAVFSGPRTVNASHLFGGGGGK